MLILKFKKGQGLGNQLWNYVVIRSISDLNNFKFKILNFSDFKGKDFLDLEKENTNEVFEESLYNFYKEKLVFDNQLKCFINLFDKKVLDIKDNTILDGILQSEAYLKPNIDVINKYIKLKPYTKNSTICSNTCILNLRGGEYKLHRELILPKSYWINAINNMKNLNNKLKFKIITDDYKYASHLLPQYEILKGDLKDDFTNLYSANYVILSNSSFGYFPVKLGKKPSIVIAPNQWARFGNNYNRWASPSNFYKDWSWQNSKGELIAEPEIKLSIMESKKIYASYNVYTCEESLKSFSFKKLIPLKTKKILKRIFSKIFPLLIG